MTIKEFKDLNVGDRILYTYSKGCKPSLRTVIKTDINRGIIICKLDGPIPAWLEEEYHIVEHDFRKCTVISEQNDISYKKKRLAEINEEIRKLTDEADRIMRALES